MAADTTVAGQLAHRGIMPHSKGAHRRPLHDRLAERTPRQLVGDRAGPLAQTFTSIRLDRTDHVAAAAVGAFLLRKLAEFGHTRLPWPVLDGLASQLTASLSPAEVMRLEVEAYEVLDWLIGGELVETPEAVAHATGDGRIVYDPGSSVTELVYRAIAERFDLKIDYFSRRRGEMNTRRITPTQISAETYLHAYCHARRSDRVFRISRITRCVPINGVPIMREQPVDIEERPTSDMEPQQLALLDD